MRYRKLALAVVLVAASALVASAGPLQDVKTVEVDPTIVSNPAKVKDSVGPGLVQDSLRGALLDAGFKVGPSSLKAHIVLDEFTSGSFAKRFLVGFGAGRSAITGHLVIRKEGEKKDLANARIHVRGRFAGSPYEGGNTQRREAETNFEQRLLEQIEALK